MDAKGLSISTSNPVAIGKLLADWMLDLNNHLSKTEKEIQVELEQLGDKLNKIPLHRCTVVGKQIKPKFNFNVLQRWKIFLRLQRLYRKNRLF